jgi:hypothetical protein
MGGHHTSCVGCCRSTVQGVVMTTCLIAFKFEGRLANQHSIDASDGVTFHEAARQLSALHAYYFTSGALPNGGAVNHTKAYRVLENAPQAGSIEFFHLIELFVDAAVVAAGGRFGLLLFDEFFADSIRQIIARGRRNAGPLWARDDRVLESALGNREPIFDVERDATLRWDRFLDRCVSPFAGCLRPLGRSADTLTIRAGNAPPITIGVEDLAYIQASWEARREQQLADAGRAVQHMPNPRTYYQR